MEKIICSVIKAFVSRKQTITEIKNIFKENPSMGHDRGTGTLAPSPSDGDKQVALS